MAFGPGLNVLTGETGAGKSLLLDALLLALGGRADVGLVRDGARGLRVAAEFALPAAGPLVAALAAEGMEPDDGVLVLTREVGRDGRSTCRVNGRLVTAGTLRAAGSQLVSVLGQGGQGRLAQPAAQLSFIDACGGAALGEAAATVVAAHALWREAVDARRDLGGGAHERDRRREDLAAAVREIDALGLRADEEADLDARRRRLAASGRLLEGVGRALQALCDGDAAARDRLGDAAGELGALSRLDDGLSEAVALVDQARIAAEEAARLLRAYAEGLSFDPGTVAELEERWTAIQRCKRRYGGDVAAILAYRDEAVAQLQALEAAQARAEGLEAEIEARAVDLGAAAAALGALRRQAAEDLDAALVDQLRELGMAGARLKIGLEVTQDPAGVPVGGVRLRCGPSGCERAVWLWSANPGEGAQELGRAASGGELSRLYLALHALRAESGDVPTLVFDEVDAGVGGRAAAAVAARLAALGGHRQVLCVTHLATVAAAADRQFVVGKRTVDGRTAAEIVELQGSARVDELARMLDGSASAGAVAHARELLQRRSRPAG